MLIILGARFMWNLIHCISHAAIYIMNTLKSWETLLVGIKQKVQKRIVIYKKNQLICIDEPNCIEKNKNITSHQIVRHSSWKTIAKNMHIIRAITCTTHYVSKIPVCPLENYVRHYSSTIYCLYMFCGYVLHSVAIWSIAQTGVHLKSKGSLFVVAIIQL